MEHWDEVRTAYQVARLGTVSGAAEVLGVHHATVIRHIDALETRLGVKLFQRHPRGYTPTESGQDLARVAQATEDQLQQLAGRIKGRGADVSGDLLVTSIVELSDFVVPVLVDFQTRHAGLTVRYLTDQRLFRLEYGEAHVAIRAGAAPQEPDNIVQPLMKLDIGLYASNGYIARHGLPGSLSDFADHFFVGSANDAPRAPFQQWLRRNVPLDRIVFRTTETGSMLHAVREGAGIGFVARHRGKADSTLTEVIPALEEWSPQLWIVTHVDLHRTAKVQAFVAHLKDAAQRAGGRGD
ncbi:LysR family transcriptional regulator [Marivita sp. GX14005]|uniref:LysR family transcriptional regulator n=1 Tax=Marivita sp. GX14005 TaxID=2942276 RepID=UPI0020198CF4|nr:LysR family transcriptional regulator [Marivita sp. GX14005]MCL3881274.1 LysR family transcriptional regulator [Marivita sp. GX14005]